MDRGNAAELRAIAASPRAVYALRATAARIIARTRLAWTITAVNGARAADVSAPPAARLRIGLEHSRAPLNPPQTGD